MNREVIQLIIDLKEKYGVVEEENRGCNSCPLSGATYHCVTEINGAPICNISGDASMYIIGIRDKDKFLEELALIKTMVEVHE